MKKTKKTPKLRGAQLLKTAVNHILAHRETWNQRYWHSECGAKHCIAGHCQILAGYPPDPNLAMQQAKQALGLSDPDADYLFCSTRTLPEIHRFAVTFGAGYNRDGYDRNGYNRNGKPLPPLPLS